MDGAFVSGEHYQNLGYAAKKNAQAPLNFCRSAMGIAKSSRGPPAFLLPPTDGAL
jgi:hypothetical protein